MRRSEAARYARWSAIAALVLASATAGVYLKRQWSAMVEKSKAPKSPPVNVERQSHGLTFSKVEGQQTIFTVEASTSTDFKGKDTSLLEKVKITIFGKTGERHDTIHTESCQYGKADGTVICSGEVQMDLQSAVDAERFKKNSQSGEQIVHVETRKVVFDRAKGIATTDQPVRFIFPEGIGEAIGVEYKSEEGTARLLHDVRLQLRAPMVKEKSKSAVAPGENIEVRGKSLDFARDTEAMVLHGPAEAETRTAKLAAGEIALEFDSQLRAKKLVASQPIGEKRPALVLESAQGRTELEANMLVAYFAPEGWVNQTEASGNVRGSRQSGSESDEFGSDTATVDLWPQLNEPKQLNLSGSVLLKTRFGKTGEDRSLQTSALLAEFSGGSKEEANRLRRAETLAPGTLEWTEAGATGNSATRTKLYADKLEMQFGAMGKPRELVAKGNVNTQREMPERPIQIATADQGVVQLLPAGGWSQMELRTNVRMREGDRSAQADYAVFRRADQTATLTGRAVVRDAATETQAPRITFVQLTGEIRAEGGVHSTDLNARGGTVQLAPTAANITADVLQANSKTGRALYSGHGRLWQGDSVLEANSIELLRDTRVLKANGNVRGVFLEASSPPRPQALAVKAEAAKPKLWHVTASSLTYYDLESRAHLEQNVVAQSEDQIMRAAALDLYFTRGTAAKAGVANGSSKMDSARGAQQISRAIGTGSVTVEQAGRKAVADRGEYSAADGKFVMSGGNPTLYDGSAGTTTGRQLTFFLADGTILVDSENGSRTLTKHRVEK